MTGHLSPAPLEHSVRLLYPFWMAAGPLDKAVESLCQLRHPGQQQTPKKTWRADLKIPELYQQDVLPLVAQVMFGFRQGANRYLRIDPDTLGCWFPSDGQMAPAQAEGGEKLPHYPVKPVGEGIELFLSPLGVGLLSLSFAAEPGESTGLPALNHRLSQLRGPGAHCYGVPAGDAPSPAPDAAFGERLGARGGAFFLNELVDFLLAPLKPNAIGLPEPQQGFSVYSVTCFDSQARFGDYEELARLHPLMAALAHVDGGIQPGAGLSLPQRVLSASHWAAVGGLGAAHLLAEQDPPAPPHAAHSLRTYFVPYLCAMMQRLNLQRLLWDIDQAILETDGELKEQQKRLRKLHQDMLRFSVQGCFTEISSREAHNQYYELALEGLRVNPTLRRVQRVLNDMESAATTAFQQESNGDTQSLARDAGASAALLAALRHKLEWLEVLFVSYFAAALAHYVGFGLFAEAYAQWSVVAAPVLSGLLALLFIQPYLRHDAVPPTDQPKKSSWLFLGLLALGFAVWVGIGHWFFPSDGQHAMDGQSAGCAGHGGCGGPSAAGTI
ncbi:MAG: hypothetical protein ACKN9T_09010 [Candidatus Methylumidiphilus sp.]